MYDRRVSEETYGPLANFEVNMAANDLSKATHPQLKLARSYSLKNYDPAHNDQSKTCLPSARSCTNIEQNHKLIYNNSGELSNLLHPPVFIHHDSTVFKFSPSFHLLDSSKLNHTYSNLSLTNYGEYKIEDYARNFFNDHIYDAKRPTLKYHKKKRSRIMEWREMLVYNKSGFIPTSHLKLTDIENVNLACSIFKELTRLMQGKIKVGHVKDTIQFIVKCGIERVELRDEIYVQLMRQTTGHSHTGDLLKAWAVFCHCTAAFLPSSHLIKYVIAHVLRHKDDPHISKYSHTCLNQLRHPRLMTRRYPPSAVEILSVETECALVCTVQFLDGKIKSISIQPYDTCAEVLEHVARKIGLRSIEGWALYEMTGQSERLIHGYEYIADVLSLWEQQSENDVTPKTWSLRSMTQRHVTNDGFINKFLLKKVVYKNVCDVLNDPVELQLLFSEAVHKVVETDEYHVSEDRGLYLAGLQLQAYFKDYDETKHHRYLDVETYLSMRIIESSQAKLEDDLAIAHEKYGKGYSDTEAMYEYLKYMKNFPLYGCSLFPISHKGVWFHTGETFLAVNVDGIKFIKANDKSIIHEFQYSDIANFNLDPNENYITFELKSESSLNFTQRSFIFETSHKDDIGFLVASYSATHTTWLKTDTDSLKERFNVEDKQRINEEILNCRKSLIANFLLKKPAQDDGRIISSVLKRLVKLKADRFLHSCQIEVDNVFNLEYWSFQKTPIKQALTVFLDSSFEEVAVKIFNSCLDSNYMQDLVAFAQNHIQLSQMICLKCLECEALANELYLQLIKQTTDNPDANSELNQWYWQMMAILICTVLPPHNLILSYLQCHITKYSTDSITVEGKYSRYCQKCLTRNLNKKRRRLVPSHHEIQYIMQRQQIKEKVYFASGEYKVIEYDSATTVYEMIQSVKTKIGMRSDAAGFGLYEVVGKREKYVPLDDRVAYCIYAREQMSCDRKSKLLFKKRLFISPYYDLNDPTECELIFHQLTDDIFEKNVPLTINDAIKLCALKLQVEDVGLRSDSCSYVKRIIPRDMRDKVKESSISAARHCHESLGSQEAIHGFLQILQKWTYFGAKVFDIKQNYTKSIPTDLKLLVNEDGIHVVSTDLCKVHVSRYFTEVVCTSPSTHTIVLKTVGSDMNYMFSLSSVAEVLSLVRDYTLALDSLLPSTTDGESKL